MCEKEKIDEKNVKQRKQKKKTISFHSDPPIHPYINGAFCLPFKS